MAKKHKPYPESKLVDRRVYAQVINGELEGITPEEYWILLDGSIVLISELRNSHLNKIVQMFKKSPYWRKKQQPYIYAEIDKRKKKQLMKLSKAARILYANSSDD